MARLPSFALPLLVLLLTFHLASFSTPSRAAPIAPTTHNWAGADSFFLFALNQTDRLAHLAAMRAASMKVVRIFISGVGAHAKGSSSVATPDLEPTTVGVFDDTILHRIDQLMLEASQHGIRLDISCHDRYALGCWSEDAYYAKYRFPSGYPNCNAQKNDVHAFYQNASIAGEKRAFIESLSAPEDSLTLIAEVTNYDFRRVGLDEPIPDSEMAKIGANLGLKGRVVERSGTPNPTPRDFITHSRRGTINESPVFCGTAQDVADELEDWFRTEVCDGFVLSATHRPGAYEDFARLVVPELQRRGLFHMDYAGTTLRENLGLERPAVHVSRALAHAAE